MRECEGCIWEDQCAGEEDCDDYTPVEDDVELRIERERQAFLELWWEYTSEE